MDIYIQWYTMTIKQKIKRRTLVADAGVVSEPGTGVASPIFNIGNQIIFSSAEFNSVKIEFEFIPFP